MGDELLLGAVPVLTTANLAAVVAPDGAIAAVYSGRVIEPAAGLDYDALFFTSRDFELPETGPPPLPTLTPTLEPTATASPTAGPAPTATPVFPTQPNSPAIRIGPLVTDQSWVASVVGALLAGGIVAIVVLVSVRATRTGRR
jgi:hypothetical protein